MIFIFIIQIIINLIFNDIYFYFIAYINLFFHNIIINFYHLINIFNNLIHLFNK